MSPSSHFWSHHRCTLWGCQVSATHLNIRFHQWVAVSWQGWKGTRIEVPTMANRWHESLFDGSVYIYIYWLYTYILTQACISYIDETISANRLQCISSGQLYFIAVTHRCMFVVLHVHNLGKTLPSFRWLNAINTISLDIVVFAL